MKFTVSVETNDPESPLNSERQRDELMAILVTLRHVLEMVPTKTDGYIFDSETTHVGYWRLTQND